MEIKGLVDLSSIDWDGQISCVLFLPFCNFRCPFCQNPALVLHPEQEATIPFERISDYLTRRKDWIDGVCITGGEPTLHNDLPTLCSALHDLGFPVKIDTNGSNPALLKTLLQRNLVDYIALDIKAPLILPKYSRAIGVSTTATKTFLEQIRKTRDLLTASTVDYEFRTTLVPTIHAIPDIDELCRGIPNCKKYVLQRFDVSLGKTTLDSTFSKIRPFTPEEMELFRVRAQQHLPNVQLR